MLQQAVKKNDTKFLKGKRLALEYDYNEVGSEYREQILAEHADSIQKISTSEINQQVENRLKAIRPRDYCLRQILKICYYL